MTNVTIINRPTPPGGFAFQFKVATPANRPVTVILTEFEVHELVRDLTDAVARAHNAPR